MKVALINRSSFCETDLAENKMATVYRKLKIKNVIHINDNPMETHKNFQNRMAWTKEFNFMYDNLSLWLT